MPNRYGTIAALKGLGFCKRSPTDFLGTGHSGALPSKLGVSFDGCVELQMLPHTQVWPQDVELGADAQVLADRGHVFRYGLTVDEGRA